MRSIDILDRSHDGASDSVIVEFFVHGTRHRVDRYRVTETLHPTRIVGGVATSWSSTFEVYTWSGTTGWLFVVDLTQNEIDNRRGAAETAHRIRVADLT